MVDATWLPICALPATYCYIHGQVSKCESFASIVFGVSDILAKIFIEGLMWRGRLASGDCLLDEWAFVRDVFMCNNVSDTI
jgi:hypothetical protein